MIHRQPGGTVRRGFSLVELLTVVGIIALLIGILLPSLRAARVAAKNTAVRALIKTTGDGLEAFHGDFSQYPDSSRRADPINYDLGAGNGGLGLSNGAILSGAHWLARALGGYDLQGMDAAGDALGTASVSETLLRNRPGRKGPYMEADAKIYAPDTNGSVFKATNIGPRTGRNLVFESHFGSPILYYRARTKGLAPFSSVAGNAIYCQADNEDLAGSDVAKKRGWPFAGDTGRNPAHELAMFGNPTVPENGPEGSFCEFLHNHEQHDMGNVIKPVRPDSYILLSAGEDARFGTDDDLSNFKN